LATEEKLDRIIASLNEIDLKMRLGKLDSLFLLIPTLTGIIFSVVQYSLKGIADVDLIIDLLPILILNVAVPLYIGYYRGGIKLKGHLSILERARGWVYLAAGTLTYAFLLVVALTVRVIYPEFVRLMTHLDPFLGDLIAPIVNAALITTFAFTVWGGSSHIGVRFLSLFEVKVSNEHRQVLGQTARAGTIFALASSSSKLLSTFPVIVVIIIVVFFALSGIFFERRARRLMSIRTPNKDPSEPP